MREAVGDSNGHCMTNHLRDGYQDEDSTVIAGTSAGICAVEVARLSATIKATDNSQVLRSARCGGIDRTGQRARLSSGSVRLRTSISTHLSFPAACLCLQVPIMSLVTVLLVFVLRESVRS